MPRGLSLPSRRPRAGHELPSLFRGFADPVRLRILNLLAQGELCVCDLVDLLRLPQSTVSRHLGYLRRAGLVEAARAGKFAHYQLAPPRSDVHRNLLHCVHTCFAGIPSFDRERAMASRRAAARALEPC